MLYAMAPLLNPFSFGFKKVANFKESLSVYVHRAIFHCILLDLLPYFPCTFVSQLAGPQEFELLSLRSCSAFFSSSSPGG